MLCGVAGPKSCCAHRIIEPLDSPVHFQQITSTSQFTRLSVSKKGSVGRGDSAATVTH